MTPAPQMLGDSMVGEEEEEGAEGSQASGREGSVKGSPLPRLTLSQAESQACGSRMGSRLEVEVGRAPWGVSLEPPGILGQK